MPIETRDIIEGIRARPAMYIGGTDDRGLQYLVFHLIDNVGDLYLAESATNVEVQIDGHRIRVTDDGPGLPFDEHAEDGKRLASLYLTQYHQTPTADNHYPHVHFLGGGLGLCALTALCKSLEVRSFRGGREWRASFRDGRQIGAEEIVDAPEAGSGTSFDFVVDQEFFQDVTSDWVIGLKHQLKRASHLLPGFKISIQDQTFYSPNGLADWCSELNSDNSCPPFFFHCQHGDLNIHASASGQTKLRTEWTTFANGNRTSDGGTHWLAYRRLFRLVGWKPKTAMLHLTLHSPTWAGPTRSKLYAPNIYQPMKEALLEPMREYFEAQFQS